MFKKTKVRQIPELPHKNINAREVSKTLKVSRNSVAFSKDSYDKCEFPSKRKTAVEKQFMSWIDYIYVNRHFCYNFGMMEKMPLVNTAPSKSINRKKVSVCQRITKSAKHNKELSINMSKITMTGLM